MPPVAVAFRKVELETNVFTKVTFIRIDPAMVLFSTRLLVTVLLVMFVPTARTVFRLESLMVLCVMFENVMTESSTLDLFIIAFWIDELSTLEFCN